MSHPSKIQSHHPAGSRVHGAGVLHEREHDPYRLRSKWPEGTKCQDCHAEIHRGAWRWVESDNSKPAPQKSSSSKEGHIRCPACTRISCHDPAGILALTGSYVVQHEQAMRRLIDRIAEHEQQEHPLERVMDVERLEDGSLLVSTTGLHLPRALGHALDRTHKGSLRTHYLSGEQRVRLRWHAAD